MPNTSANSPTPSNVLPLGDGILGLEMATKIIRKKK